MSIYGDFDLDTLPNFLFADGAAIDSIIHAEKIPDESRNILYRPISNSVVKLQRKLGEEDIPAEYFDHEWYCTLKNKEHYTRH